MAKEEKKAPKLRFNGYTNDWERKKLGILITRVKSYPLSRSVEVKKETDVKYVHYGDIHTNIADEIDKNNNLPFINEIYKEYDELKLDDVIVADASEDYKGIADAAVIISNLPYTIIAGLHTIALRPTSLIKGYFLYHIFKTENFKRFGYKIGTGLKVFGISYNNLAKYKVYYPQEIEEQKKIIGILSNLTNSINLHERKCEELALIKKALLQKLFPKKDEFKPEVRYKNFSDAWEQRKLGEILSDLYNGQTPSRNVKSYWKGDIPWLTSGELNHGIVEETIEKISESGKKAANLRLIPSGTIVIAITGLEAPGTRGNCAILGIDTTVNQSVMALVVKNNIDTQFIFQWYKKIGEEYGIRYTQGTKQQSYNYDLVKILPITIPTTTEEQQKIGSFFNQLDSLIALHQRKLEKLKQLKKFLLQNMFI